MTTDHQKKLTFPENLGRLGSAFLSGWQIDGHRAGVALRALAERRSVILGSGASRSLAILAEKCLRAYLSAPASALTPWSLDACRDGFDAALIFSASGDNADARASVGQSLAAGYNPLLLFTQNPQAAILREVGDYENCCAVVGTTRDRCHLEREGFLGILSLVEGLAAFSQALSAALSADWSGLPAYIDQWISASAERVTTCSAAVSNLAACVHVVGLAGYWGEPVLADLESKWVEGGLGWIEISEFRNFSHGRYMNSFGNRCETAFVTISTPDDTPADEAVIGVISDHFEVIRLRTPLRGLFGAWDLWIQMLHLYSRVAEIRGINVTAPTVPEEGRRLFSAAGVYPHLEEAERLEEKVDRIVQVKRNAARNDGLEEGAADRAVPRSVVRASYALATTERYYAIGLDFDGTLVPLHSGEDVPPAAVCAELERLVSHHVPVGIFSGRGRSVIRGLREGLARSTWPGITGFLYNGAMKWRLDLDSPSILASIASVPAVISGIKRLPTELSRWFGQIEPSSFGCQITINLLPASPGDTQTRTVEALSAELAGMGLSVASSGRSVDIYPSSVSKRTALMEWGVVGGTKRGQRRILRIGDRGDRTGNDYDFLQAPGGFSVDRVDWSPYGCFPADSIVQGAEKGPPLAALLLRGLRLEGDGCMLLATK